ncbi:MAG TPA: Glu/Leu/Phe/Val dehydrogenase dimerization domain-containing protein [Thermoanaerobaculia bacterium]|nr:Glu/Leu/Phe/Val dehydrogenase dimerization domain-containing protein [Thermoanaerobaculia bacterium]
MAEAARDSLQALIATWDGEAVVARFDRPSDAWIFVALHSNALGAPVGGTRMQRYPSPAAALHDAMRLAEGMTAKWAVLGLDVGGGKAVIAPGRELTTGERRALLRRYGDLVESLRGAFGTGEDLGTTPEDMALVAERTGYVHGRTADGSVIDPGPFTARGVLAGMAAAAREAWGPEGLAGRTVLVQGIGDVGLPLARLLHAAGARLLLSDLDDERLRQACDQLGAERVAPQDVLQALCDVFSPCAVGGILDFESVGRLPCRVVAGSANAQLAEPDVAMALHRRGILYVPDYVINAGGALAFGLLARGVTDRQELMRRVEGIGATVHEVLVAARERDESPVRTAQRRVERALAAAKAGGDTVANPVGRRPGPFAGLSPATPPPR